MLAVAATFLLFTPDLAYGSSHDLPGKPSISVLEQLYTGLRAHWDAPASDGGSSIIRYEVQYKRTDDDAWVNGPRIGTVRKATIRGLRRGSEYQVRVRAVNANGAGPWTDGTDKQTALGINLLSDPPDVTMIPRNQSLTLYWELGYLGNSFSASHVNVQFARFDGPSYTYEDWTVDDSTQLIGNSTTITDLENGQDYLVRVRVNNGTTDGTWSVGHLSTPAASTPFLKVEELVTGLQIPWDLDFTPDGTMLFTQRVGDLRARLVDGTVRTLARVRDTSTKSEGGLMAILVDPSFSTNRRFYTCQTNNNATAPDYKNPTTPYSVEVIAWTVNANYTTATAAASPLVSGIPGGNGQHNGCRLRFGPSGYLWIATGDAVGLNNPQSLESLGGKVLRVDASTGAGVSGNFLYRSADADSRRIYTYGHRNIQGLALRPGTSQMWVVEHGSYQDDEINLLVSGKNYGWNPARRDNGVLVYKEVGVPMTDLGAYPNAVPARWSSGESTLATSGGIFLEGKRWGDWEGRLAVAILKDRQLQLFAFNGDGHFQDRISVPVLNETKGRLRSPVIGPDGALYITTSNGGNDDKILKVTPVYHPGSPDGLTVVPGSAVGDLDVSWTAPTDDGGDAVTGYRLRYSKDGTSWTDVPDTVSGLTKTITGLDEGVEYQVQVRAVNGAAGGGSWSQSGTGSAESSNEAPTVASAIGDVVLVNESATRDVSLSGVFADADNDSLTITAGSSDETKATVSVASDNSKLTVTAKSRGTATITVTADDGNGGTAQDSFTVTVKAAPVVASALSDVSLEVEGTQDITLSDVFSDADGDALTFAATSTDLNVVNALEFHGTLTIIGAAAGSETVTVTAQDSDGNAVSDAFDVEVVEPPDPVDLDGFFITGTVERGGETSTFRLLSNPWFDPDTAEYTIRVPSDIKSITFTPAWTDAAISAVVLRERANADSSTLNSSEAARTTSSGSGLTSGSDPRFPAIEVHAAGRDPRVYYFDFRRITLSFGGATVEDKTFTEGGEISFLGLGEAETDALRLPIATGGFYNVTYTVTGLPAGLWMGGDGRLIHGTPESATTSPAEVDYTATDDIGGSATLHFHVSVAPPMEFDADERQAFKDTIFEYTVGQAERIEATLPEATGGHGTLTYGLTYRVKERRIVDGRQITGGVIKTIDDDAPGFSFDADTRVLTSDASGSAPSAEAFYSVDYWAEDENGARAIASNSIAVNEAPTLPEIADQTFTVGENVSITLPEAAGGTTVGTGIRYELEPAVHGIVFNGRQHVRSLFGTPHVTGTTEATYTATDRNGVSASRTFTIDIVAGAGAPASAPDLTAFNAATESGRQIVFLDWADASGATGYVVQVIADAGTFPSQAVGVLPEEGSITVYGSQTDLGNDKTGHALIAGLNAGDYKVRVAAANGDGAGPWSDEVAFTVPAATQPPPRQPQQIVGQCDNCGTGGDLGVVTRDQAQHADLIAKMNKWRDDPEWSRFKEHTDRWDRALLAFGETVADTTLTPMTASEAQGYADRGSDWSRWVEVAAALREIESAGPTSLIAKMHEWRNDPEWSSFKEHTDRWDRALLAFGETVADTTLTPMTAAEAKGFADRGSAWSRWVEVAAALQELESAGKQEPGVEETDSPDIVSRYDADGDGSISQSERLTALNDYYAGRITYPEFLEVNKAYAAS